MFTRSDLSSLMAADPALAVSIFLPTHVRGAETQQDPVRLKNLVTRARGQLLAAGMPAAEAGAFLSPATALIEDYEFWQHQDQGLAVFVEGTGERHYRVPVTLDEQVVVGPGFRVRALLPVLAADGAFLVLTMTAGRVRLYHGSRFALAEDESAGLTRSLDEVSSEPGYENPVQAAPVARPHTGSINIGNAQVYGDSPAEWRKAQLVKLARRVATEVEALQAAQPLPVVLTADAELAGHFRKASTLGSQLAGTVEVNPEALDDAQLHEAAYALIRPQFDAARQEATKRFAALLGQGDPRAATGAGDVVRAAWRGQVDTLLLNKDATAWGRYHQASDEVEQDDSFAATGQDLLETAAIYSLENGATVHVLASQEIPGAFPVAAILRY
ncbi:MAG: hypothetical protein ACRDPY_07180 [Streptosporangiaceae bacterium]